MKFICSLVFFFVSLNLYSQHFVDTTTNYLKQGSNIQVSPGDTIYLEAGNRPYLMFENIKGTADSLITIINHGGEVRIHTNHYFGIITVACEYFRICGNGHNGLFYGINIDKVEQGGGIGISALSNHFELDHIRIANTKLAGIYAKTDPDTTFSSVRDSFLMADVKIHDMLIEHVQDEGMYIGSTKFFGQQVSYHNGDTLLFPHYLKNVEIYNNKLYYCGWDAIQLSSAIQNASIHDNVILYDSQRKSHNQMSGIMLGGGTQADCYNNYIAHGAGSGIVVASIGGQKIYNNIIIEPGLGYYPSDPSLMQHGIYVGDISTFQDSSFVILNNLIFSPKSDGIRFTSLKSKNNVLANNVIIHPGNYSYYDTLHTQFTAWDSYIMVSDSNIDVDTSHNIFQRNCKDLGFEDTLRMHFTLRATSPLIEAGRDISMWGINVDHFNNSRLSGAQYDIGPFEFNSNVQGIYSSQMKTSLLKIYPNPCHDVLEIQSLDQQKIEKIRLFNVEGKEIFLDTVQHVNSYHIQLNLKNQKPGVYFLRVKAKDQKPELMKFLKI